MKKIGVIAAVFTLLFLLGCLPEMQPFNAPASPSNIVISTGGNTVAPNGIVEVAAGNEVIFIATATGHTYALIWEITGDTDIAGFFALNPETTTGPSVIIQGKSAGGPLDVKVTARNDGGTASFNFQVQVVVIP